MSWLYLTYRNGVEFACFKRDEPRLDPLHEVVFDSDLLKVRETELRPGFGYLMIHIHQDLLDESIEKIANRFNG